MDIIRLIKEANTPFASLNISIGVYVSQGRIDEIISFNVTSNCGRFWGVSCGRAALGLTFNFVEPQAFEIDDVSEFNIISIGDARLTMHRFPSLFGKQGEFWIDSLLLVSNEFVNAVQLRSGDGSCVFIQNVDDELIISDTVETTSVAFQGKSVDWINITTSLELRGH